jgi:glucose/arabinose dehydrogenase
MRRLISFFIGVISAAATFGQPPSDFLTLLPAVPSGLSNPVTVVNADDGTGRLFIVEQTGKVRILQNGALLPDPFIDLGQAGLGRSTSCATGGCGERGLLRLAYHPDNLTNDFFYVYYTRQDTGDANGDIVIERYSVSADPNLADTSSRQTVLIIPHPAATNHNGGNIAFRPQDGAAYLYAGTGDGGSTPQNGQDLNSLLGKILRLDVDGIDAYPADATRNYAIPVTNPFVGFAGADEIWDYGLRNPYRWSFDRQLGALYIGDVGQSAWEEIDFDDMAAGGINYGWDRCEGKHDYTGTTSPDCDEISAALPILEFDHSVPPCASVTGGFVYRGSASATIAGKYIYGDYCTGRIWSGTKTGPSTWVEQILFDTNLSISGFGEDENGKLYFTHHGGSLYRLAPHSFDDVLPDQKQWTPIESVYLAGVSLGCDDDSFCSDDPVQRQQIAALLVRAQNPVAAPGDCTSNPYTDVLMGSQYCKWVKALQDQGIASPCGGGNFCPEEPVSRGLLAAWLLKTVHPGFTPSPPVCNKDVFEVAKADPLCPWIRDATSEGLVPPCDQAGNTFCRNAPVRRDQLAALLVGAFPGTIPEATP